MPSARPRIISRVFAYLKRYPLLAAVTLLCALGSSVMVIIFPVVTQRIIDDVLRGGNSAALWPMIALAAFGFLAQDGLNTLRILLNNTFEQKVLFDLRSDLYTRLQSLPLTWFDHRATGDWSGFRPTSTSPGRTSGPDGARVSRTASRAGPSPATRSARKAPSTCRRVKSHQACE